MHIYCILMSIYIYASRIPSLNAPNSSSSNNNIIVIIIIISVCVCVFIQLLYVYKFHARISRFVSCSWAKHFYVPKDKNEKYLRPNRFWSMRILVPDICIWHCLIYLSTSVRVITYYATAQSYSRCSWKPEQNFMYAKKGILFQMHKYFYSYRSFVSWMCHFCRYRYWR